MSRPETDPTLAKADKLYESGLFKEALQIYQSLARSNVAAQYKIGLMYKTGIGLRKDPHQAFYWFLMAANKSNPKAQTEVAKKYYTGEGTKLNKDEAAKYIKLAADQGDEEAKDLVGTYSQEASAEAKDKPPEGTSDVKTIELPPISLKLDLPATEETTEAIQLKPKESEYDILPPRKAAPKEFIFPPKPPRPKKPKKVMVVRAKHSFKGLDTSEMNFSKGDLITILSQEGDWWVGLLNGVQALVPSNYVEFIEESSVQSITIPSTESLPKVLSPTPKKLKSSLVKYDKSINTNAKRQFNTSPQHSPQNSITKSSSPHHSPQNSTSNTEAIKTLPPAPQSQPQQTQVPPQSPKLKRKSPQSQQSPHNQGTVELYQTQIKELETNRHQRDEIIKLLRREIDLLKIKVQSQQDIKKIEDNYNRKLKDLRRQLSQVKDKVQPNPTEDLKKLKEQLETVKKQKEEIEEKNKELGINKKQKEEIVLLQQVKMNELQVSIKVNQENGKLLSMQDERIKQQAEIIDQLKENLSKTQVTSAPTQPYEIQELEADLNDLASQSTQQSEQVKKTFRTEPKVDARDFSI